MSWFTSGPSTEDTIFNLKFTAKQLSKQSDKGLKDSESEKKKVKKALEKGNKEAAAIYAQNSIRKKSEANKLLRLASRLDAVVSRIQAAQMMKGVAKQMGTVVKGLDKAMGSMNLVEMSDIMDKFETQIDELDVIDQTMGQAMDSTTGSTVNPTAVDDLMKQMADDMGMEAQEDMAALPDVAAAPIDRGTELPDVPDLEAQQEADLNRRLAALREA